MRRPTSAKVDWDSARFPNDDVSINFLDGEPAHLVRISREALEDGLRTSGQSTQSNLFENMSKVEQAIAQAYKRGDWEELVEIYSRRKVFHLWVGAEDFPRQQ